MRPRCPVNDGIIGAIGFNSVALSSDLAFVFCSFFALMLSMTLFHSAKNIPPISRFLWLWINPLDIIPSWLFRRPSNEWNIQGNWLSWTKTAIYPPKMFPSSPSCPSFLSPSFSSSSTLSVDFCSAMSVDVHSHGSSQRVSSFEPCPWHSHTCTTLKSHKQPARIHLCNGVEMHWMHWQIQCLLWQWPLLLQDGPLWTRWSVNVRPWFYLFWIPFTLDYVFSLPWVPQVNWLYLCNCCRRWLVLSYRFWSTLYWMLPFCVHDCVSPD